MMADDRDPFLQSLFGEAGHDLAGETFTNYVMSRTRNLKYLAVAGAGAIALILAICLWLLAIPSELAQLSAEVLTQPLIPLGEGWLTWLVSPVNNIGGLLVLIVKVIRVVQKQVRRASYRI